MKNVLLFIFSYVFLLWGIQAQNTVLTGKVSDAINGNALPGVSVSVKGSTAGVVTDMDGNYSISLPQGKGLIIEFSFIGMKTQEIAYTGQKILHVALVELTHNLNEVVVTGYQKIDRKLFTGSAVKLEGAEVKLEGVADVSRSLQGTVAGVEIENVSGTFGTAPVMRIRGNASILGGNRPLMVVDGVVMEDAVEMSNTDLSSGNLSTLLSSSTASINPEDIESFQVLKDASATALYGARAMNGVIVITTKRGRKGTIQVDYSMDMTLRQKPNYTQFDILSSGAEMSVYQELYEKGWIDIASSNTSRHHGAMQSMFRLIADKQLEWRADGEPNYDYLQYYADANTDWFDHLFKTSLMQQHSVSITQGSEKATVRASFGFMADPGVTEADKVKNYTGAIRADFNLNKKLRVGMKVSGNVRDQLVPSSENRKFNAISGEYERNFDINPFNYALYTSRSMTPYDKEGNRQFYRRNFAPFNILHEIEHNYVELGVSDVVFQGDFDYKASKSLVFNGVFQGRWYTSEAAQKVHENSNNAAAYRADDYVFRESNNFLFSDEEFPLNPPYSVLPEGGFLKTTVYGLTSYMARFSANYSPKLHEDHLVNFLIGQELRYTDRTENKFDGWGYLFDKGGLIVSHPDFIKYLDARGEDYYGSKDTYNRSIGAFVNMAYSYQGKYILNATGRYDGDNRTGKSNQARYLPTWNLSGAWNIASESFMEDVSWLDVLKLKATYGLSGDNPAGKNASASLLLYGSEPLRPHLPDRETGLYIQSLANEALTYEKLYETNLGLEVSLFSGRIFTEIELWHRKSVDLVGLIETSGIGGEKYKYGNIGEMLIQGIDFTLNTQNIVGKHFKWSTAFNYSYSEDEITRWESRDRSADAVSRYGGNFVGYSKGSLFSYDFAGLDAEGIPTFNHLDNSQYANLQDRDGILENLVYEGPTAPTSYGGITNNFSYKNVNLSIGLVFRHGSKIRLDDAYYASYKDYKSLPGQLANRWQFEGDENYTIIPAILDKVTKQKIDNASLNPYALYNKSTVRVADGDFIRLKNIRLGYHLPKIWLARANVKAAEVSLSAYNLALLYADKELHGIDPEFFQSGGISMPLTPTYTFSLNIKF